MITDLLDNPEALIRFVCFIVIFAAFAIWEKLVPRRELNYPKSVRWVNNLGMVLLNTLIIRLGIPVAAISAALFSQQQNLGVFNFLDLPIWLEFIVAVIVLDLALYVQHLIFHHVHFLWRLHRMHHADLDIDVSTAIRFHPIEIILSMFIKMAVVFIVGAPIAAVILFEILLNATSVFNHANIYMPKKLDQVLRLFLVTPDMHRVHHSIFKNETNSNFGFNLPWWDYIFRTYNAQPKQGHKGMTIGIEYFRDTRELWLDRLLLQPFRNFKN